MAKTKKYYKVKNLKDTEFKRTKEREPKFIKKRIIIENINAKMKVFKIVKHAY